MSSLVVDGVSVLLSLVGSDVNEDGMGSSVVILVLSILGLLVLYVGGGLVVGGGLAVGRGVCNDGLLVVGLEVSGQSLDGD